MGITIVLIGNHELDYQKVFKHSSDVFDICIEQVEDDEEDDEDFNYKVLYDKIWKIPTHFKSGDVISCKMGPFVKGYHELNVATCPECGEKKSIVRQLSYENDGDIFGTQEFEALEIASSTGVVSGRCTVCGYTTPCFLGGFPTQTCIKLCVRDEVIPKSTRLQPPGSKKRVVKMFKKSKELFPKNMMNAMCFGTGKAKIVGCSDMSCVYEGCGILLEKLRVLDDSYSIYKSSHESLANWHNTTISKLTEEELSSDVTSTIRFRPTISMINVRMVLDFDAPLVKMVEFLLGECQDIVDTSTISVANHNKPYTSINIKKDSPGELVDISVMGWEWKRNTESPIETQLVEQNTSTDRSVTFKFEPSRKITFTVLHYIEPKINILINRLMDTKDKYFVTDPSKISEQKMLVRQLLEELK